jgi:hypothetical protein
MKKNFGNAYKVGDEVFLSEPEGGKEYKFTVVEITKDVVYIENEDGRTATLTKPVDH